MADELDGLEGWVGVVFPIMRDYRFGEERLGHRALSEMIVLALAEPLRRAGRYVELLDERDVLLSKKRIEELEAEMKRSLRSDEANRKIYAKKLRRIEELEAGIRSHKCVEVFTAGDGDPGMRCNDGSDLAALLDTETKPCSNPRCGLSYAHSGPCNTKQAKP